MAEVFAWGEGQIYLWTGTATASARIGYAQNVQAPLVRGWANDPSLAGSYRDHLTGLRADVLLGALYTPDATIQKIEASATAVHLKLLHALPDNMGSAGTILWSGRIDSLTYVGNENNLFQYTLAYHANRWSAFGL